MSAKVRISGILVLLVGAFGALVPLAGPSVGYKMGTAKAWTWSESIASLHVAPGIAAFLGGLMMLGAARSTARLGAVLGVLAGAWFVVGPTFHPLWAQHSGMMMMSHESTWSQIWSSLGYHYGTGVVIAAAAAFGLGVLGSHARAVSAEDRAPAAGHGEPTSTWTDREPANVG